MEKLSERRMIRTFSGVQFDLYNPTPDMINIADIAAGLARKCRFSGQCPAYYSVAQHSVYVTELLEPELKPWGLLHDAGEAYLCDAIRPIKGDLSFEIGPYCYDFEEIEDRILETVAEVFGLSWPMPDDVYQADNTQLAIELPWAQGLIDWGSISSHKIMPPADAELYFLGAFASILPEGVIPKNANA